MLLHNDLLKKINNRCLLMDKKTLLSIPANPRAYFVNLVSKEGRLSTEVAFALPTQLSWVQFSAFPKLFEESAAALHRVRVGSAKKINN